MFDYIAAHIYATQIKQRQDDERSDLQTTNHQLRELAESVRKMALVNQALLELIKEKTTIGDDDLRRRIKEVDLRDGKQDGKLSAKPMNCPKCGFAVTAGAMRCQTCGAKIAPKYPYEA